MAVLRHRFMTGIRENCTSREVNLMDTWSLGEKEASLLGPQGWKETVWTLLTSFQHFQT